MCLNGTIGPRLDNEPRPFAVTPPHQRDREKGERRGGGEGNKKSRMREKEKGKRREEREEREEEIKNDGGGGGGGGKEVSARKRGERKRAPSVAAEEAERWRRVLVFQKGRINGEGLRIVQPRNQENGGGRESSRGGERGWPLTRGHYREGDYGCSKLSKHSPRDPS